MSFVRSLRERAARRLRTVVFAEGEEPRILDATVVLVSEDLVHPVLVGRPETLIAEMARRRVPEGRVRIVDPNSSGDCELRVRAARATAHAGDLDDVTLVERIAHPLATADLMVAAKEVDGCVAGILYPTADVLRHALWWVGRRSGVRTVSSAFYMVVRPFRSAEEEVLTFTDPGVVPEPDVAQLVEIAEAAVIARRRIVGDEPCVAFLSFSTHGSAGGPRVERVREATRRFRERNPEVAADGELQGDAALIPEVADRKAPGSDSAGRANVLVFPDLDSANIAYKLVERLAGATALGPVVQGLKRPCNDLSRGASAEDIVEIACITSLMAD